MYVGKVNVNDFDLSNSSRRATCKSSRFRILKFISGTLLSGHTLMHERILNKNPIVLFWGIFCNFGYD